MILKDLYKDYFRIGVACEKINDRFTNHEIGNPDKEALMCRHFNSMTFANELKPAYNMGFDSEQATEEYLPFVINPQAKSMLDFAKEHGFLVRGHVLVWHSQCPKEIFCKGYQPVTIPTDPQLLKERPMMKLFEPLDPVCFTDRETMKKRMKSYIFSVMDYMYRNNYATTIYAWDVVNEAIELMDKTPTGLRNSYWYRVIGDDFIYWAFRFAKDAVVEASKKYATQYGVDVEDETALKRIQLKLIYNDYNEWMPDKKAAILAILGKSTKTHGSVFSEGLIDGIGMQGHLSDNNNIDEYIAALKDYAKYVSEIHITELDVKCTCTNANEEYYQAVFYKKLFEELVAAKREGFPLTSVTLWGLTDDNSWIRGANPLLFHKDLSPKRSFDGLVYALTGESLGEPQTILCNLSDRYYDFEAPEGEDVTHPEDYGFKMKGFGPLKVQNEVVHSGRSALAQDVRFDNWSAISFDVSDFIGQTIEVSAWVKSAAKSVSIFADISDRGVEIASVDTSSNEWVQLKGRYKVPQKLYALFLSFHVQDAQEGRYDALYVDDIEVKLIGMEESFEEDTHIASIRGAGHLPFLYVTADESRDGKSHSLCVTRQEKDATMKFNVSSYIGNRIIVTAFVKTKDSIIRLGLDGTKPTCLAQVKAVEGQWTPICAELSLDKELNSAQLYIETDGNADYYVDDIFVTMAGK